MAESYLCCGIFGHSRHKRHLIKCEGAARSLPIALDVNHFVEAEQGLAVSRAFFARKTKKSSESESASRGGSR
jgi:hypothetical protein